MKIALSVFLSLSVLLGAACFTALTRFLWQFPERARRCTVCTVSVLIAVSAVLGVWCAYAIPEAAKGTVYAESAGYDAYLVYSGLFGLISALLLLGTPHLILRTKRILRLLPAQFTAYMLTESGFAFISVAFGLNADGPEKLLAEAVYDCCVYAALIAVFYVCASRTTALPLRGVIDSLPRWVYPAMTVFSFTVYAKEALFDGGIDNPFAERVYNALWVLATLGVIFCIGYFLYKLTALNIKQNQILRRLDTQESQYAIALKTDEELREFRHDYKNHMMVVTALLNAGHVEEATDYLEKMKVISGTMGKQFSTGNFIADAILNAKNSYAEEYAVHISFKGRIPAAGIENDDLCIIFSNLTDNAIEAAKRAAGSRFLNIESSVRNGYFTLTFTNPVAEKAIIKNNRIKTTKTDAKNHGVGLRNVEKTAERYGGKLLLSCTDERFQADVMLKLDHTDEEETI